MKARKGVTAAASTMLALTIMAAPAAAQICSGFPTAPGQTSVGLRASFPTGGTTVGVEASRNWLNAMGAFANVNLLMPDGDDADNVTSIGAGLAYEIGGMIPALPATVSLCPVAGVTVGLGDPSTLSVPVGIGVGTSIGTTEGFSIQPFAIPQIVLTRFSSDGNSTSSTEFGIGFGAFAKFSGVYGGITLGKVFVEGSDVTIAFQGGLVFPARAQ